MAESLKTPGICGVPEVFLLLGDYIDAGESVKGRVGDNRSLALAFANLWFPLSSLRVSQSPIR